MVGDLNQLPPIPKKGKPAVAPFNAEKPDIVLTKGHRTDRDEILNFADLLQGGERPTYGKTESLQVVGPWEFDNEMLARADQVICGVNRTRAELNHKIRKLKGYTLPVPEIGERLVALRTYRRKNLAAVQQARNIAEEISPLTRAEEHGRLTLEGAKHLARLQRHFEELDGPRHIANGSLWSVASVGKPEPPYAVMILRALDLDDDDKFEIEARVHHDLFDPDIRKQSNLNFQAMRQDGAMHFEYAHAITAHKAQGSEYDCVVVVDEARHVMRTPDGVKQWRYTAATRAKQQLVWLTNDARPW
jgi:exodeoxyribonuclease-5